MSERPQISRQSSHEEFDSSIFSDAEVVEYLDEIQCFTPCRTDGKFSKVSTETVPAVEQHAIIDPVPIDLIPIVNLEVAQVEAVQSPEEPSLFDVIDLLEFSDDEYSLSSHRVPRSLGEPNQPQVIDLTHLSDDEFGSSTFGDDDTLYCLDRSEITFQNQHQSKFLCLPPEIRNMIYEHAFVSPEHVGSGCMTMKEFWKNATQIRFITFAKVCRQIYTESRHVFLAKNGFEFSHISTLVDFLEGIGIEGRRLIRRIKYDYSREGNPFRALRYLKSCTNIQELNVNVRVTVANSRDYEDAWVYPLKNAKDFFLTPYDTVEFGPVQSSGYAVDTVPDWPAVNEAVERLTVSLNNIKREEKGTYNRHSYPNVFTSRPYNPIPPRKSTLITPSRQPKLTYSSYWRWESIPRPRD